MRSKHQFCAAMAQSQSAVTIFISKDYYKQRALWNKLVPLFRKEMKPVLYWDHLRSVNKWDHRLFTTFR